MNGKPINIGDTVSAKRRGGKQTGVVEQVITREEDAQVSGVQRPPKVIYTDQHGPDPSHGPWG
jgi:Hypervirulence associated proteins TUDOR domain